VLALLRRRGLLSLERIGLLYSWRRSGFSVHNRVLVHPRDGREFEALVRYMLFVALFGLATASHATPITYTLSGTAFGTLGSSSFTDALVTVTATADTDDVTSLTGDLDGDGITDTIHEVLISLTTVRIAGLGTVNVVDPTAIYAFPPFTNVDPGEEIFHQPVVVIGTVDSPPSLDSFTGIAAIAGDAFS
jgi:hypothetical protein